MISLFGTFSIFLSLYILARSSARYRIWEHIYHTLAMVLSPFIYNLWFEPIPSLKTDCKYWCPNYLWKIEWGSETFWLSVANYVFVYMYLASLVRMLILFKRKMVTNLFLRLFVYIPAANFSTIMLIAFVPSLLIRILFVGQFSKNWIIFVVFAIIAPFCIIGSLQTLFTFETSFSTVMGVGKKKIKSKKNEKPNLAVRNNSRRFSKRKANKIVSRKSPNSDGEWNQIKIIQITDPHLGPWMSAKRFKKICQRSVDRNPDIIVITGDMLTVESMNPKGFKDLSEGMSPFKKMKGRVFACIGNHDEECLVGVEKAFLDNDIIYLKDQEHLLELDNFNVQILGIGNITSQKVTRVCQKFPPNSRADLRIVLLHDPTEFKYIPPNEKSLVLSGHTHGGWFGLNFLGIPYSLLDFGTLGQNFYEYGENLLYVHRGTGVYGWPMRTGTGGEQSMMNVYFESDIKKNNLNSSSERNTDEQLISKSEKSSFGSNSSTSD
ncbi:hypothetical protein M0812_21696 [Anaeramoeba flamelloides]|uniref:Calcineurin-like phosphoesterase domain-containing protein n=1 Tax=Anaeramoeba flamelloides TaxID=1746091 RepID=A0AAV7YYE0_9EUKA|nr:hypothetical protein M0812_21696 [Anaeramoeba flamelloides]